MNEKEMEALFTSVMPKPTKAQYALYIAETVLTFSLNYFMIGVLIGLGFKVVGVK